MVIRERRWRAAAAALLLAGCGDVKREAGPANSVPPNDVECVDVAHVDAMQNEDLEVIGSGFEADEGQMVRILVTHREPNYGLGEAPIVNGSFDLYLPGVLGGYTGIAVHIDSVRDNACDAGEKFWQWTTGGSPGARGPTIDESSGHAVAQVTPDALRVFPQAGPCSLNGVFDLTTPLACTR